MDCMVCFDLRKRMTDNLVDSALALGRAAKENWYLIAGAGGALWASAVRLKRTVLRPYVTNEQMRACKDEIIARIEENTEITRKLQEANARQHEDILKTVIGALTK